MAKKLPRSRVPSHLAAVLPAVLLRLPMQIEDAIQLVSEVALTKANTWI